MRGGEGRGEGRNEGGRGRDVNRGEGRKGLEEWIRVGEGKGGGRDEWRKGVRDGARVMGRLKSVLA